MVSGEADGSKRTVVASGVITTLQTLTTISQAITATIDGLVDVGQIIQYAAGQLKSLQHGSTGSSTQEDEGTENQSSEYTEDPTSITLVDSEYAVETGTYSLSVGHGGTTGGWVNVERPLGTSFTWEEFVSMSFSLYRPTATSASYGVRVGLETSDGLTAYKEYDLLTDCPTEETWYPFTITKSDFDSIHADMVGSSPVTLQKIWFNDFAAGTGSVWYIDSWTITSEGAIVAVLVDTDGHLQIDPLPFTPDTIGHGQNTDIDTTAEQLTTTSTPCKCVIVQADKDNTDKLYIGGSGIAVDNGVCLGPRDAVTIWIDDVNKIYAIGGAANQAVHWLYVL